MTYKERSKQANRKKIRRANIFSAALMLISILLFMVGVSGIEGNTKAACIMMAAGLIGMGKVFSLAPYFEKVEDDDED